MKIKPCSYCGGAAEIKYYHRKAITRYKIKCCKRCTKEIITIIYNTLEQAIKAWNRRKDED